MRFAVGANLFASHRNLGPVTGKRVVALIKDARKQTALDYRKAVGMTKVDAERRKYEARPIFTPELKLNDNDYLVSLNRKIEKLSKAIRAFKVNK